jgi:hypothetical protein
LRAKSHPWPARFIIIFSFGVLNIVAIITGMLLDDLAVTLPQASLPGLLLFCRYFKIIVAPPEYFSF